MRGGAEKGVHDVCPRRLEEPASGQSGCGNSVRDGGVRVIGGPREIGSGVDMVNSEASTTARSSRIVGL